MRAEGGMSAITAAIERLSKCHPEHISQYGTGNEERLTGGWVGSGWVGGWVGEGVGGLSMAGRGVVGWGGAGRVCCFPPTPHHERFPHTP